VNSLLSNQSRLTEEQKQFQEQPSDSEHIQSKLIAKLTTSEQQESKMVQVLSARAKRLSNALQHEKEKFKTQKRQLKEEMAQVFSTTKETLQLQQEKEAQRVASFNVVQKAKIRHFNCQR